MRKLFRPALRRDAAECIQSRQIPPPRRSTRKNDLVALQNALGNRAVTQLIHARSLQPKLKVSQANDRHEQEAERIARQVMGMTIAPPCTCGGHSSSGGECSACKRRAPTLQRHPTAFTASPDTPVMLRDILHTPGQSLTGTPRAFMEARFRANFDHVRLHTDAQAAASAQALQAQAYTVGHHVVFGAGQYRPGTMSGLGLLAHELTHVLQQTHVERTSLDDPKSDVQEIRPVTAPLIQRRIYEGYDHGGRYEIDDQACTFVYHQNWFFTFRTRQTTEERQHYMEAAKHQVEDVWSNKFPLIPSNPACACSPNGISVSVIMHPYERERQGRGFTIIVTPNERRGFTNQPLRRIDLGTEHDLPVSTGVRGGQQRIAHEFGHTIGLTDEYHGWAHLFNTEGSQDEPSIMHSGDEVRPRHYQHFADLVNLEMGGNCQYLPNGLRLPEYENPVNRFGGLPFPFLPSNIDFLIGLQFDRRLSNEALLGLIYPTGGMMSLWNPETHSVLAGPTVGLRLNQIAHPLYVNVRTGLLFDPENPARRFDVRLPISTELGIRGRGFTAGANYTAVRDLLDSGEWTHLVGVGLQIDLPLGLRR